ncbi:hypothetical protein FEM48_Zijuj07G0066300 [Ziziphus jujuba var. spinosa]|uniref:DUF4220 domain-containing protein n=1 Tax=Ziziphus jujuba var. spinosa TaxID=714518 RepID=A0A978V324_ZIZJJ|nr:hypothetical protein FEM48_Zijuj07G0066300 [Ziziphus jujuba var. spinosa]
MVIDAGYCFLLTLPNNKLWLPTILVFVVGNVKHTKRTIALYLASVNRFGATVHDSKEPDAEGTMFDFYLASKSNHMELLMENSIFKLNLLDGALHSSINFRFCLIGIVRFWMGKAIVMEKTVPKGETDIINDNDLQALVRKMRKAIGQVKENCGKGLNCRICHLKKSESMGNLIRNGEIDHYGFTSWCRFPFYKVNFGWGKPACVSTAEEDVAFIETNEQLLDFASLKKIVLSLEI